MTERSASVLSRTSKQRQVGQTKVQTRQEMQRSLILAQYGSLKRAAHSCTGITGATGASMIGRGHGDIASR